MSIQKRGLSFVLGLLLLFIAVGIPFQFAEARTGGSFSSGGGRLGSYPTSVDAGGGTHSFHQHPSPHPHSFHGNDFNFPKQSFKTDKPQKKLTSSEKKALLKDALAGVFVIGAYLFGIFAVIKGIHFFLSR